MKKIAVVFIIILIIIIIIPFLILEGIIFFSEIEEEDKIYLNVYQHKNDKIVTMELSEYLKGVVAAEMPAIYNMEALKAQAVAARTYALRQLSSGNTRYPGADISTDFRYNQAWISKDEMKEKWGFIPFFYFYSRISAAVELTRFEVLLYNNKIIDAVYHSNSGGQTESSEDIWEEKKPYLRSVESPFDSGSEKNYRHRFEISYNVLEKRLGINAQNITNIKIIDYNEGGSVNTVRIADKIFEGREVRDKLGLPSAKFEFIVEDDKIICEVTGFGHGVGMSQDGANGFGKKGYNYREILKHYYTDVEIADYREIIL